MFKKILLASFVVGFSGSVCAADITNPFYLPKKNQVGSISSMGFDKNQAKVPLFNYNGKSYNTTVLEELQYGLTDSLAFIGGLGNTFNKNKSPWGSDSEKIYQYFVGMGWNALTGPFNLQLDAAYNQTRYLKTIGVEVKGGYQLKKYLPYISVGEVFTLDNKQASDKNMYNAKIGLYQGSPEKWALDTGIRWMHDELGEQQGYNAEVETSYYLAPQTALSVYGTYLLYGKGKYNEDLYDKSIGVKLRWFFN